MFPRLGNYELHKKHIKRSQILELKTETQTLLGHQQCAKYLENSVSELLLHPAALDIAAQDELLAEVEKVFTPEDNKLMTKVPNRGERVSLVFQPPCCSWNGWPNNLPILSLLGDTW